MTLIQQQMYFSRFFEYDSSSMLLNAKQKKKLEGKVRKGKLKNVFPTLTKIYQYKFKIL